MKKQEEQQARLTGVIFFTFVFIIFLYSLYGNIALWLLIIIPIYVIAWISSENVKDGMGLESSNPIFDILAFITIILIGYIINLFLKTIFTKK